MKGRDLLEALSFVDEEFVEEAEREKIGHHRWRRLAALAACLCVIAVAAVQIGLLREEATEGIPEERPESMVEQTQAPDGEVECAEGTKPALVLRVDQWQEDGFLGTVVKGDKTLEAGTQVTVICQWDQTGETQVNVYDYTYDPENHVIYVEVMGKDE